MSEAVEYAEEVAGIFSLRLYDEDECRSLLERVKEPGGWSRAQVVALQPDGSFATTLNPDTRSARAYTPGPDSAIRREFDERIDRVIKPLVGRRWRVGLETHAGTHFVRYGPGDYYTAHTDTGDTLTDRYFTVLCYLNADFKGGATSFPTLSHSVSPRTGMALVFPSTYLHRAETVTGGEKYVLVTWLTGPPPIKWI